MPNLFEIASPRGYVLSPYGTGKLIKKKHYPERKARFDLANQRNEDRESKKQRLLQDKTIPQRICDGKDMDGNTVGCLEKFPDDPFFFVEGKKLCGKNANNCSEKDSRKIYITEDNPTGIRHNYASTTKGRKATLDRALGRKVSETRRSANEKGLEFELTKEWAIKRCIVENNSCCEWIGLPFLLLPDLCEMCGEEYKKGTYNPMHPSIDRIDSNKGYTEENSQIVWAFVNVGLRNAPKWLRDKTLEVIKKSSEINDI